MCEDDSTSSTSSTSEVSEAKKTSYASLRTLSGISDDSIEGAESKLEYFEEKKWRLSHLKSQFESLELHELFKRYTEKINHGYFSLFLILETCLSFTHFLVLLITNLNEEENLLTELPDLILYLMNTFLSAIGLYITDILVNRNKNWKILPVISFTLIFFTNAFVTIYDSLKSSVHLRTAYSAYLIICCYVFFNVFNNLVATIMGISVSIFYILSLVLITYPNSDKLWLRIISDVLFTICINGLGIYFRYMNEIVTRRSFLDRRECIVSKYQLKHEKDQEEQLMSSIIPAHLITKVKEIIFDPKKRYKPNPFDNPLLNEYDNITILFADIVHYTEMTTKLNINDLLETLNELFGRFDDASDILQVKRIKFLGDCYYCVAGMPPDPAPNHGEACVDLGLKMISIIANIRQSRSLNINMRIGIHTGKIICGIIGGVKYQFDIWSKDVDIANRMETEGSPGKVHITNQTKELLTKHYHIVSTDKGDTVPQFKKFGIQTFLVSPTSESETPNGYVHKSSKDIRDTADDTPTQRRSSIFKKKHQNQNILLTHLQNTTILEEPENIVENDENNIGTPREDVDSSYSRKSGANRRYSAHPRKRSRFSEERSSVTDVKRRTAFMNNNIKRYAERSASVNDEMKESIERMSFSKYQQYFKLSEINNLLLFRDKNIQRGYMKEPDPLFKYYLLSEIFVLVSVYLMQNLTLPSWDWNSVAFYISISIMIFVFLPITWTHHIWNTYVADSNDELPRNIIVKFLYDASMYTTKGWISRLLIYTITCILFGFTVLSEVIDCKETSHHGENVHKRNLLFLFIRSTSSSSGNTSVNLPVVDCIIPWHMTETCSLAIIMTFLFLRITMWIKLLYAILITAVYGYCVVNFSSGYYTSSETFNVHLPPQIAHIMSVVFLTFTLHLIDRQTEYMNKLDYLWTFRLLNEKHEADELQRVNKSLLLNILPKHVAKIYLDINRQLQKADLYHEDHDDVAVMFASIIVNDYAEELGEKFFLNIMNQYILQFDTIISREAFKTVEKIKIAKWTYMAACGLVPGGSLRDIEKHTSTTPVITLLCFASEIMKSLEQMNRETKQNLSLRIGISHGPIVAGVVGSKKPLYDIWGDPVNMASRMDTTGEVNKIQVLEKTAEIIHKLGYKCEYRDKIKIKGKDEPLPTYFVPLDKDYNLIKDGRSSLSLTQ